MVRPSLLLGLALPLAKATTSTVATNSSSVATPPSAASCAAVANIVSVLNMNKQASSFCSSVLAIKTTTTTRTNTQTLAAISTITNATATSTQTASAVTVTGRTSTVTVPPTTVTITTDALTSTLNTTRTLTANTTTTVTITAAPNTVTAATTTTLIAAATTTIVLVAVVTVTAPVNTITASTSVTSRSTTTTSALFCGTAPPRKRDAIYVNRGANPLPVSTPALVKRSPVYVDHVAEPLPATSAVLEHRQAQLPAFPGPLQGLIYFPPARVTTGCQCLNSTTPTATVILNTRITAKITTNTGTITTVTTTPTSTITPLTTSTPTTTSTVTPTVYISPSAYFTPVSTFYITPTVTQTPSTTVTPTSTTTSTPTTTTTPSTTYTPTTTVITKTTVPGAVLASPTALTPQAPNGTTLQNWDDQYFNLTLPFSLTLFNTSSAYIGISVNGFVTLGQICYAPVQTPAGPAAFGGGQSSGTYPSFPVACKNYLLGDVSFVPFWSDLFIRKGTNQGLFYQISTDANGTRSLNIEWLTTDFDFASQYYHFVATFSEAKPGQAVYSYYQVSDLGSRAEVGVQNFPKNTAAIFSKQTKSITPGLQITYQPGNNSFTAGSIASCQLQT